jgi:hypothetical protein
MSAESVLYAALSGAAGVTTLVSDRIYPDNLPQGKSLPAAIYARAKTDPVYTIHNSTPVIEETDFEIWCFAQSRQDAESLGDAVKTALASASLKFTGRRFEFDAETETFSVVIECNVWV